MNADSKTNCTKINHQRKEDLGSQGRDEYNNRQIILNTWGVEEGINKSDNEIWSIMKFR